MLINKILFSLLGFAQRNLKIPHSVKHMICNVFTTTMFSQQQLKFLINVFVVFYGKNKNFDFFGNWSMFSQQQQTLEGQTNVCSLSKLTIRMSNLKSKMATTMFTDGWDELESN